MQYSFQDLLDLYVANRHQDVVNSVDQSKFSAIANPSIARVVAASQFQLGNYSDSIELLSEIESCFLEDIEYLSLYGACLRRNGDLALARVQFERALKISPESPSLKNNYANLLIDLGSFDDAESILRDLIDTDPDYQDAQVNWLRLLEAKRLNSQSSDDKNQVDSWIFSDPLLLAFSQDEVQKSVSLLSVAEDGSPLNKNLSDSLPSIQDHQLASDQLKMAQQAVLEGRYDFALQLCSQAKSKMPHSAAIYECVSDAYISKRLFKEAEICLLHAMHMGSPSFKTFVNLISLACLRKDFGLAQHYFEKAQLIDATNSALPKLRAQIVDGNRPDSNEIFRFDAAWSIPDVSRSS